MLEQVKWCRVALADTIVELMAPEGDGPLRRHHVRYGDGIRSTVFKVRDLDAAGRYLADRGVTVEAGDADGTLALPLEAGRGVRFELSA